MAATTYEVKIPLVIARDKEGRDQYLYKGATIPDSIPKEEVDRLLGEEFIGKPEEEPAPAQPKG